MSHTWGRNERSPWKRIMTLGVGFHGRVELFKNRMTGDTLAIKTPIFTSFNEKTWRNEQNLMRDIEHPNIVKILPLPENVCSSIPGTCQIAMEYCDIGTMSRLFAQNYRGFEEGEAINALRDLCKGLLHMHDKNIVHCNINPSNILVKSGPTRNIYKLAGFGSARPCSESNTGSLSLPICVAPEVRNGERCSFSSDYWSFGFITVRILTGMEPFFRPDNIERKPDEVIFVNIFSGKELKFTELPKWNRLLTVNEERVKLCLRKMLSINPKARGSDYFSPLQALLNILPTELSFIFNMRKQLVHPSTLELVKMLGESDESVRFLLLTNEGMPITGTHDLNDVDVSSATLRPIAHYFILEPDLKFTDLPERVIDAFISNGVENFEMTQFTRYADGYVSDCYNLCKWTFESYTALFKFACRHDLVPTECWMDDTVNLPELEVLYERITKRNEVYSVCDDFVETLAAFKEQRARIHEQLNTRVNYLVTKINENMTDYQF